ncbi:retrotransposon-related protein [Tanacetum coccineum]
MNSVPDVSEGLLISLYISGLKPVIQRELLVSKPTSLGDAFSLACVTEARSDDQVTLTTSSGLVSFSRVQTPKPTTPHVTMTRPKDPKTPLISTATKPPLVIKWISPAERQERLSKGLCFNCDNKWVCRHKCPRKFLLLMADEEDDTVQESEEDAVESDDISILNSLIGQGSPRSLQLWGTIGSCTMHVLIDNGSTHNFVRPYVVEKMRLPVQSTKPFKVYIGSRETLLCESICSQVMLSMQGLTMEVDLYVLPMKGPDVVLGIQRLQKLWKVPTTLPPHRIIDHRIHLLPNTKPVNVRPYHYPHYQKCEMEKLVKEIMEQGIIRFSQSSFSSPVLLVKKKDGSYRFYVDYRALNKVTIKDKFPIPTADEMFDKLGDANIFTKLDLRKGVKMDPKKVTPVMEWPVPTTQRHIRGFLGLAGYYQRVIKTFATVAAPLSRILQKQGFYDADAKWETFKLFQPKVWSLNALSCYLSKRVIRHCGSRLQMATVFAGASFHYSHRS